jgi:hypothetical protein
MELVRKENDPTISTPFFSHTVWNSFESIWQPGILLKTARTHGIHGGYSKFGPCMNTVYRNIGQFTAQNKNCHLIKPWSHGGIAWNLGHTIKEKYQNIECLWEWCVRQYRVISVTWRFMTLDRNLGQSHHIYYDNFCNSMRLTPTLLDRNMRVWWCNGASVNGHTKTCANGMYDPWHNICKHKENKHGNKA